MSLAGSFLRRYLRRHARDVRESLDNPESAQRRALERIRRMNAVRVDGLQDCVALPVSDSNTLSAAFREVFEHGAPGIVAFGRTSGTMGEPKHIPINREYLRSFDRSLLRMIACLVESTESWELAIRGKRILLGSRPIVGVSPSRLPIHDISGYLMTRSSRFARRLYVPTYNDLWIEDWETKVERILEQARGQNIVSISGIPALARDFTERARDRFGVSTLSEVWPQLSIYIYGGTPLAREQMAELERAWLAPERKLACYETFFATEGAIAFALGPAQEGLALNLLENVYVFESMDGTRALAHELKRGQMYSLRVTTPGGLVNYAMGDRFEVISERPLLIRFVGRDNDEISMTGEKITLSQVDLALASINPGTSAGPAIVWVESGEKPRLVWAIPGEAMRGGWAEIPALLDAALCRSNPLYAEALVHEKVVLPSKVVSLEPGLFVRSRKPRRLFNSREELERYYLKNS